MQQHVKTERRPETLLKYDNMVEEIAENQVGGWRYLTTYCHISKVLNIQLTHSARTYRLPFLNFI